MKTLTLLLSTLISLSALATTPKQTGLESINRRTAEAHIGFLASDELEGREAGTHGARIAANYIESVLKDVGVKPWNDDQYSQPFIAYSRERQTRTPYIVHPDSIAMLQNGVHRQLHLNNIMGIIEGKNKDEIVIIGAHYDHLGVDSTLTEDQIYNGADDNASGVAAVLQIARAFVQSGIQPERTIIFAFWDGEEKGLLGSQYFVITCPFIDKIKGYLNFDMIGRNHDINHPEHVVYFYTASHPAFEEWLRDDIVRYGLNLDPDYRAWDRPVGGGDNSWFALRDIPIIWYHTDGHPDYHMPSDEADRINYDKTVDITKAAYLNLWNLANEKVF